MSRHLHRLPSGSMPLMGCAPDRCRAAQACAPVADAQFDAADAKTPVKPPGLCADMFGMRGVRGFTLIEILVVVVILGILAAIVVPRVMEHPGEARRVRAKQDIQAIVTALNTYRLDNFSYPTTEQGLEALVSKPSGAPDAPNWHPQLDKIPKDPWNRPYLYLRPGAHGDIDVFTYGADGKPGGDGEDADVGNWDL